MTVAGIRRRLDSLKILNPRRSQAAGALWLIAALSLSYAIGAAVWVGGIARENVVEQHARRLALETDQLSSDLSQAIVARLGAIRAMEALPASVDLDHRLDLSFRQLTAAYPQFQWILVATRAGDVLRADPVSPVGHDVSRQAWFQAALKAPWVGQIPRRQQTSREPSGGLLMRGTIALGDLAAPVHDRDGRVIGVVAARLTWQRSLNPLLRLTDEAGPRGAAEALLLDSERVVVAGTADRVQKQWDGVPTTDGRPLALTTGWVDDSFLDPHFERLAGGSQVLVARALLNTGGELPVSSVMVQLSEPNARVYQRADAVRGRVLWFSMAIGLATAVMGALGAHQLTRRLKRLVLSVDAVERNQARQIEAPQGIDEIAQLGRAFANVLNDLHTERSELQTLSRELERRVAVRTREVERLAEETRYAAVARERLKMARDLHDTLAHSMMALLSEIRYLRRLQVHEPTSVAGELARAEDLAHEGLNEVRTAITEMRVTTVRDTGLGPALAAALERLLNRSGMAGELIADPEAALFGDERAETLLNMCQEALRNVERHAAAKYVRVSLRIAENAELQLTIEDDGVGFDPTTRFEGHYGIVGLREQAELIGATLAIDSAPGGGTAVRIALHASPMTFGLAGR